MKAVGRIGLVSLWGKYSGVVSSTYHQADKTAVSGPIIEQYHQRRQVSQGYTPE